ncbi:MAG: TlpA family protein disulfide reductase [Candidatus Eisenbacteria bacterium]|nr:TlpA family protein disulfide reductase [Candidatus Eisenbacteria bacterium]
MQRSVSLIVGSVVLVAAIACPVFGKEYSLKSLKAEVDAAESAAMLRAVFQDYLEHAVDIDVARASQDQWRFLDEPGVRAFAESLYQANADSGRWIYLRGRMASAPLEQIEIGRRLVAMHPEVPWGFRLIVGAYDQYLFADTGEQATRNALAAELPNDLWCFHELAALQPTLPLAGLALFDYHVYRGAWDSAQALFDVARAAGGSWAGENKALLLAAGQGRYDEVLGKVSAGIDTMIAHGAVDPQRRDETIRRHYDGVLRDAKAYDELVRYLAALPGAATDPGVLYDLACYSALAGRSDEAFAHLEGAVEAGWNALDHTQGDPDLASLRGMPRWEALIARLSQAASAVPEGEGVAGAIGDTLSTPAPDWALADVRGDTVRLADLKGSVVVLDFFATWCGPCRMALPVLSRYVHEAKPEGARVYSIDVWEKPFAKAEMLWESEGLGMTLLKGTDDLGTKYGFDGIPFICVVDKAGQIRAKFAGYSDGIDTEIGEVVDRLLEE